MSYIVLNITEDMKEVLSLKDYILDSAKAQK